MRQFALCLILPTLFACEGQVSIELSGTPPEQVDAAILKIDSLTLLSDSETDTTLDVDSDVSFLSLGRGRSISLVSSDDVPSGSYNGIRLNLSAEDAQFDSYLTRDGEDISLSIGGNSSSVSGSFELDEDESLNLSLHFDLRSSLALEQDADSNLELRPRLRLSESGNTGSIAGDVGSSLLSDEGCDDDDGPEQGEVVYAFSGSNQDALELGGDGSEPVASALISRDAVSSDYVIGPLAAGDYTLAITCEANLDDPDLDDGIRFIQTLSSSITAGQTTTLNFE